jgi:hypothetical protein
MFRLIEDEEAVHCGEQPEQERSGPDDSGQFGHPLVSGRVLGQERSPVLQPVWPLSTKSARHGIENAAKMSGRRRLQQFHRTFFAYQTVVGPQTQRWAETRAVFR